MKHPFQVLAGDTSGKHLFAGVKTSLYVFETESGKVVGSWSDSVKEAEQPSKKAKTEKKEQEPQNFIRSLTLSRNEKYIICTTDNDKSAVVFSIDYSQPNCLTLVKRQPFPKRPCAASTTMDDANLIVADKFGDVFSIPIAGEPVEEKLLEPIMGHVSMLSDVTVADHNGKQFIITGDRDEHVRVTHFPESFVVKHWLFGHREFVSSLNIASFDKELLISGGGDDFLLLWKWFSTEKAGTINLREHIQSYLTDAHYPPERHRSEDSPKEVTVSRVETTTQNGSNLILVLCENTKCIIVFEKLGDEIKHHQTLETSDSVIDFAIVNDHVIASLDKDSQQVALFKFADGNLTEASSSVSETIDQGNNCNVESRDQFLSLYNNHLLRKRSEH